MENIINGHKNTQHTSSSASAAGMSVLNDMQDKLHLADESGIPRNAEQTANIVAYFKASQRIKKIFLIARRMLPSMLANLPIFQTHQEK